MGYFNTDVKRHQTLETETEIKTKSLVLRPDICIVQLRLLDHVKIIGDGTIR